MAAPRMFSSPMPRKLSTYLMALATVTLWGASFPLSKAALNYMGPTSLAFLRWTISAAALIGWLSWARRNPAASPSSVQDDKSAPRGDGVAVKRLLRHDWVTIAWVALSGITLFYWLENTALNYTTATNAGVLSNLTAVFMVLIAAVILRERLRLREWAAMSAAFIGAVLISQGAGNLTLGGNGWTGDLLMVVASLFAAIYSIGGKRLSENYPPVAVTTAVATTGAFFLLPFAVIEGLRLDLPPVAWGILILLGLGAGALANLWWLTILARMKAARAALALFLIPVISATLSVALLGEPLTLTIVAGALLVLGGVMAVQSKAG